MATIFDNSPRRSRRIMSPIRPLRPARLFNNYAEEDEEDHNNYYQEERQQVENNYYQEERQQVEDPQLQQQHFHQQLQHELRYQQQLVEQLHEMQRQQQQQQHQQQIEHVQPAAALNIQLEEAEEEEEEQDENRVPEGREWDEIMQAAQREADEFQEMMEQNAAFDQDEAIAAVIENDDNESSSDEYEEEDDLADYRIVLNRMQLPIDAVERVINNFRQSEEDIAEIGDSNETENRLRPSQVLREFAARGNRRDEIISYYSYENGVDRPILNRFHQESEVDQRLNELFRRRFDRLDTLPPILLARVLQCRNIPRARELRWLYDMCTEPRPILYDEIDMSDLISRVSEAFNGPPEP